MLLDLRDFLRKVDDLGELKHIEGAHWDLEIGCISMMNVKRGQRLALLFDKIAGYPAGYRVLTSSITRPSRVALTFGLPPELSEPDLLETVRRRLPEWQSRLGNFPARVVKGGPVTENVHSGKDINILEFPVPRWHDADGGRYIGTGCAVITRDAETGQVNLGTYRIMAQTPNVMGFYSSPGKHGRVHYEKYHSQGKPAPVAVSIGHHPLFFAVSSVEVPHHPHSEYDFISSVTGQPVEVIEEEATGLPIPAGAETVIAGWCPPEKALPEGPFGEFTGYYGSKRGLAPVIEVERVYHRNNPILLGAPPERTPSDHSYYLALLKSAMVHNQLISNGFPDVGKVWVDEMGHQMMAVVSLKQRFAGQSRQVALATAQSRMLPVARYVMVVDEDIDPANIRDVIWALCTRTDPVQSIDIIQRAFFSPLDPTVPERPAITLRSRAIIDACKPFERKEEYPEPITTSPDLIEKTKQRWGAELGFS